MNYDQRLWKKAKKIIPGGNQFLSKRPELYSPSHWPAFYRRAKGVEIWGMGGEKYLDMSSMGLGSCIIGYADPDINKAVKEAMDNGSMSSLNCYEEVQLAELMCRLHPWAQMVRYARTGGEAMTVAVRIARSHTKKSKIIFCGYHGWADWYLAANLADNQNLDGHLMPGLEPRGVPRELKGTSLPFNYNKIDELKKIISQHKDIAAIVLEPLRHEQPENNFLQEVRKIATKIKAVLIFDEITIAWRLNVGGVHLLHKVNPDIAVFGKAMSNGYPMAAIIGRRQFMLSANESFMSSTYWSERVGPAAALATIKKLKQNNIPAHLERLGKLIEKGWQRLADRHELKINIVGPYPLITFSFDYGKDNQSLRTLFIQEMLKRKILATTSVYLSYSHKKEHIEKYLALVDEVFGLIKQAIRDKNVSALLDGPDPQTGFKRLVK